MHIRAITIAGRYRHAVTTACCIQWLCPPQSSKVSTSSIQSLFLSNLAEELNGGRVEFLQEDGGVGDHTSDEDDVVDVWGGHLDEPVTHRHASTTLHRQGFDERCTCT